jgi:pimeloyl-ACP methyl ester carboxylesterase
VLPASLLLGTAIGCGALAFLLILNRIASNFPPSLAKWVHWIHAIALECLALTIVFCCKIFVYSFAKRKAAGSTQGRPILLVHGYINNSVVWLFHRHLLKAAGLGPIYAVDLGHPFRSIREYAQKVKERAEQIAEETGRKDLILIGHSMGGIVSAWYATHLAPPGTVTDVIAIGSPFAGTPMARIGLGPNAREMEVGSQLVLEMQREFANDPKFRFYQIATTRDQLVYPVKTSLIGEHPARQLILEDIGHVGLLYSKRVSQKIISWISVEKPI